MITGKSWNKGRTSISAYELSGVPHVRGRTRRPSFSVAPGAVRNRRPAPGFSRLALPQVRQGDCRCARDCGAWAKLVFHPPCRREDGDANRTPERCRARSGADCRVSTFASAESWSAKRYARLTTGRASTRSRCAISATRQRRKRRSRSLSASSGSSAGTGAACAMRASRPSAPSSGVVRQQSAGQPTHEAGALEHEARTSSPSGR